MSNIKLIEQLNNREINNICENVEGCAECPLLISSYQRRIHCLKDQAFQIYEAGKVYQRLNTKIDLDTNKLVED